MNKRLKTEGNWKRKSPSKYNKIITKAIFCRWMDRWIKDLIVLIMFS